MTTLDPAYCADGCGRLAETERPTADGRREQVCTRCAHTPHIDLARVIAIRWGSMVIDPTEVAFVLREDPPKCSRCHGYGYVPDFKNWDEHLGEPRPKPCPECTGEHSSNPREDG